MLKLKLKFKINKRQLNPYNQNVERWNKINE